MLLDFAKGVHVDMKYDAVLYSELIHTGLLPTGTAVELIKKAVIKKWGSDAFETGIGSPGSMTPEGVSSSSATCSAEGSPIKISSAEGSPVKGCESLSQATDSSQNGNSEVINLLENLLKGGNLSPEMTQSVLEQLEKNKSSISESPLMEKKTQKASPTASRFNLSTKASRARNAPTTPLTKAVSPGKTPKESDDDLVKDMERKDNSSVGVYATALRNMLRRMSLAEGDVSLQSLDQVIAMGKEMVKVREGGNSKHDSPVMGARKGRPVNKTPGV
jgi:hypothetical protein